MVHREKWLFTILVICFMLLASCGGGSVTAPPPPADPPPTVTSQPTSVTVTAGQPASFTVAVTGTTPFTYQWTAGMKGSMQNVGANSATYTINPTTLGMNGEQAQVTISNAAGSVTSQVATLTVNSQGGTIPTPNPVQVATQDFPTTPTSGTISQNSFKLTIANAQPGIFLVCFSNNNTFSNFAVIASNPQTVTDSQKLSWTLVAQTPILNGAVTMSEAAFCYVAKTTGGSDTIDITTELPLMDGTSTAFEGAAWAFTGLQGVIDSAGNASGVATLNADGTLNIGSLVTHVANELVIGIGVCDGFTCNPANGFTGLVTDANAPHAASFNILDVESQEAPAGTINASFFVGQLPTGQSTWVYSGTVFSIY